MRKLVMAALVALIGAMPLLAAPALAQTEGASPTTAAHVRTTGPLYPVLVGLGAITGVAVYNMASFGAAGVPFVAPAATTGLMVTNAAISRNRLYTVISAVAGAWVVNWLYGN
ncbi:MAG: hypothetical protein WCJ64_13750 [Rhodospirillaceae bacterium]